MKRKADDLRVTFLTNKARALSNTRNLDEKNIYSQLLANEKQRRSARKIKFVLKTVLGGGVTKISLVNNRGEWEEITDKEKIKDGSANENKKKYRQTESTPCMQGQLATDLGFIGNTAAGQQLLEGRYIPPPGTSQYTTELLDQLQYHPSALVDPPEAILHTKDYIDGWIKKKEFTSAGKSGWTFSH